MSHGVAACVPLLVTMDLEVAHDHDPVGQAQALASLRRDLADLRLPLTVFATADSASAFQDEVRATAEAGHEIGCHGLAHTPDEDYRAMDSRSLRGAIAEATERIRATVGRAPTSFRAPSMTTSSEAQRALIDNGYSSDFSVCAQRMDVWNSRGGTIGWWTTPRQPYRPSPRSPFRRGDRPLLIVPMRCLGLPFLSGVLYLFGYEFMRLYFRALLCEARKRGGPIVYLFHSYEFADYVGGGKRKALHSLYRRDRRWRYRRNLDLLRFMLSFRAVVPMTASSYVASWESAAPTGSHRV